MISGEMEKRRLLRNDMLLLGTIVCIGAILWLVLRAVSGSAGGGTVRILSDGEEIGRYPLSQERVLIITKEGIREENDEQLPEGEFNVLVIADGGCFVRQADCPDRVCVKQGRIFRNGESIICLPHHLVIEVVSGTAQEVDTIAR